MSHCSLNNLSKKKSGGLLKKASAGFTGVNDILMRECMWECMIGMFAVIWNSAHFKNG